MGRRRTRHHDLPPGLHRKRGRYYYGRRMEALGPDLAVALREWARRRGETISEEATFSDAARHYRIHALHKVAASTQREYSRQLVRLENVFGRMRLADIEPSHIHDYMEQSAAISGTREKALFSVVFNHARRKGLTKVQNPAAGIRGKASRRTIYVSDEDLVRVLSVADAETAAFLELCWRTGADASTILLLTPLQFRGDVLHLSRSKTGQETRIQICPELRRLAQQLPFSISLSGIRKRFWAYRQQVGVTFTIKDLRAKAGTDAATTGGITQAQRLLGHADPTTTGIYIRRSGTPVTGNRRRLVGKNPHRPRA